MSLCPYSYIQILSFLPLHLFRQIPIAIAAKGVVAEDVVVTAEAEDEEAAKDVMTVMDVEEVVVMDEDVMDVVVVEVVVKVVAVVKGVAVVQEEVQRVAGPRASMSRTRMRSLHCRIARPSVLLCFAIRHSACNFFEF